MTTANVVSTQIGLLDRMTGYCDGPHVKEKINELIDAHNQLVRHITRLKALNYRGIPLADVATVDEVNDTANTADTASAFVGTTSLTRHEINGLTNLLMQWGWRCSCVVPVTIKRDYLIMCKTCGKPVPEEL